MVAHEPISGWYDRRHRDREVWRITLGRQPYPIGRFVLASLGLGSTFHLVYFPSLPASPSPPRGITTINRQFNY